jgi:hypothetical protein
MSIEKSHFFDRIGAVLTTLWTLFEPCGSDHLGEEGRNSRHPSVRDILRPASIGREEISMIRLEPSRNEQARFPAAFLVVNVLAPRVLARQQTRTCVCSLRAGKLTGGKSRGPTRQVAPHRLRDSRHAVCSRVRRNSIGGEPGRVDGSRGSEVHASTEVGGLERAPAVAPDQCLGEGPAGGTREKNIK